MIHENCLDLGSAFALGHKKQKPKRNKLSLLRGRFRNRHELRVFSNVLHENPRCSKTVHALLDLAAKLAPATVKKRVGACPVLSVVVARCVDVVIMIDRRRELKLRLWLCRELKLWLWLRLRRELRLLRLWLLQVDYLQEDRGQDQQQARCAEKRQPSDKLHAHHLRWERKKRSQRGGANLML